MKEKVTKIIDGDTFLTNRRKIPVRLNDVDTPEKRQPGYKEAKEDLSKLIKDKEVKVDTICRDKFRRPIANVEVDGKSVNKAMQKHQKK